MKKGRDAGREVEGGVGRRWRRKQRAGEVQTGHGGRDTGGAHREHVAHVCDAGRVQAQWLVERICVLPSPRGSMERGRHAGREVGVGGGAAVAQAACRGRSRLETGGEARVGRTENM